MGNLVQMELMRRGQHIPGLRLDERDCDVVTHHLLELHVRDVVEDDLDVARDLLVDREGEAVGLDLAADVVRRRALLDDRPGQ